jgi:hypothetical protein
MAVAAVKVVSLASVKASYKAFTKTCSSTAKFPVSCWSDWENSMSEGNSIHCCIKKASHSRKRTKAILGGMAEARGANRYSVGMGA